MRKFGSAIFLSLMLLGMSVAAFAADHTVQVGGSGLVFTPASLTITAGDTVTFVNVGGFHNVVANDGSFRCATDCTASGGAASSTAWSSQVTYASAGSFGYYCEIHGGPGAGMHGAITVQAATTPPPPAAPTLGGGLSGNWYNPDQGGSGFQLEVTSNASQMLAIWFVFPPAGSVPPTTPGYGPYSPQAATQATTATVGQQWIYAQGTYDPTLSTITMPAVLIQGTAFPFPASNYVASDVANTSWGTLTFTFSDCNNAVVSWNSTITGYGSGSMPLTRLTQIAGTTCQ